MDGLTERAMKLLRECPILIEEAEDGAPIWNSIAGNLLAMETGCSRWATEKAVRESLRLMKRAPQVGRLASPFAGASIARWLASIGPRMKKPRGLGDRGARRIQTEQGNEKTQSCNK
jgi:hypothetical protein